MDQNNAPAAGQQSEREAFEAWCARQCYRIRLWPDSGRYHPDSMQSLWEGWQARATLPAAAACAEQNQWHDVARDGMPKYEPDVTYIGINSAGYAACFTIVEPDGTCWAEGAEESVCVMSELRQWRVLDRPGASLAPPARNGEMSKDLAARIATALECGVLWTEGAEAHPRMKNALADFTAWLSASCAPKQTDKESGNG